MTQYKSQGIGCILATIAALVGCGGPGESAVTGPLGFSVQSAVLGFSSYSAMQPTEAVVFLSTLTRQDMCAYIASSVATTSGSVLSFNVVGRPLVPGDYPINPVSTLQAPQVVITVTRFDLVPGSGVVTYNPPASGASGATGSATLTSVSYADQSHFATSNDRVQGTLSASLTLPDGGTSPLSASFDATGCP
ncbi:MAG TPA: hypothetical protein VLM85_13805 [Polyangiaceae bacterium]|nr:hypothetical protein [Polyangiaceae bacterium]